MILSLKWSPSSLSLSTIRSLNTAGMTTGGGFSCCRRAARSAFIASTSECRIVAARSGESLLSTGSGTGRNTTVSARAKSFAELSAPFTLSGVRLGSQPGNLGTRLESIVSQGACSGASGWPWCSRKRSKVEWMAVVHEARPPELGLRRYHSPEPMTSMLSGCLGVELRKLTVAVLFRYGSHQNSSLSRWPALDLTTASRFECLPPSFSHLGV